LNGTSASGLQWWCQ